jgi:hypothetical protein
LTLLTACGGGQTPPSDTPAKRRAGAAQPPADPNAHPLCGRPIAAPSEVWPRIEAIRALPEAEFREHCGLETIELIAYWRIPPVDLLSKVVSEAAADEEVLVSWVKARAETDSRLARHVVAMDIIGGWQLGKDTALITEKSEHWKAELNGYDRIAQVAEKAEVLHDILPKVTRVHELRCMLEVNPLGFAVSCDPIHKRGQDIDLNWKAKSRDGLLQDLELTRCTGSRSCKELKKRSVELKGLYLSLMREIERIRVDVFEEQLLAWMVLRPFE